MGYHGVPQMPIFAYKAIGDEVSVIADTDALVDKYCNIGANILYRRNTIGMHGDEDANGRPAALRWLSSVLGGTYGEDYPALGCTIQTVTIDLSKSTSKRRNIRDKQVWSWLDTA
ncbi:hypothetical protein Daus18300_005247 [Diaporthe australafricana]|uniref:Uncharacterized protein n=1 Tax=Diaporthe australafricana TaxID=127596 RepID=A0ABR3X2L0_9PEZI